MQEQQFFWGVKRTEDEEVTLTGTTGVKILFYLLSAVFFVVTASCIFFMHENKYSSTFPIHTPITINDGSSFTDISTLLKKQNIIRSQILFKFLVLMNSSSSSLRAGIYTFPNALSTREVIEALRTGTYSDTSIKVTIPEGSDYRDVARIIHAALPQIDATALSLKAKQNEGYLFPETYHVSRQYSSDEFVALMRKTFDEKTKSLVPTIEQQKISLHDVVVFASILEKEGIDEKSMRTISGILWKRISLGMPLQIDATFAYYLGKNSRELTADDLRSDSLYNTYTHKGLPPEPIGNPGLMAITAVLNPLQTNYLYYLTGTDGTFHYAKTFEEHKINKERYLH